MVSVCVAATYVVRWMVVLDDSDEVAAALLLLLVALLAALLLLLLLEVAFALVEVELVAAGGEGEADPVCRFMCDMDMEADVEDVDDDALLLVVAAAVVEAGTAGGVVDRTRGAQSKTLVRVVVDGHTVVVRLSVTVVSKGSVLQAMLVRVVTPVALTRTMV